MPEEPTKQDIMDSIFGDAEEAAAEVAEDVETVEEETEAEPEVTASEEGEDEGSDVETEVLREIGGGTDKQLEALQQQIAVLNAQLAKMAATPQAPPELEVPVVTEDEYMEIMRSPEEFNNYIKKLYKKSIADARELILKESGSYISPQVRQQVRVQMLAEQFFQKHPHLAESKAELARLAEHYENQQPGITPEELFGKLDQFAKKVGTKKKATPKGLASSSGTRKPSKKAVSDAEKDVADLFDNW